MNSKPITISLYENSVPPFVEPELDTLYGHVFSSIKQFRIYNRIDGGIHTYVALEGERKKALLLFRCHGNKAQVLNEQIAIETEEINRFARHVFDTYPSVDMVCFHAVRSDPARWAMTLRRGTFSRAVGSPPAR